MRTCLKDGFCVSPRNMDNTHHYRLSIPLNINDLNHIEEGILWEDIKFEIFEISKTDYDNLFDLFCQFDKPFDIIIDEYEEEIIPASGIDTAIQMTKHFATSASPDVKSSAEKLLIALVRAKELGKQIILSF